MMAIREAMAMIEEAIVVVEISTNRPSWVVEAATTEIVGAEDITEKIH